MKVMQIGDTGECAEPCLHGGSVDAFRNSVEAQVDRRFEEPESGPSNHGAHEDRNNRM